MHYPFRFAALFVLLVLVGVGTTAAQAPAGPPAPTSNDFFDDSVLHSIRLEINPRDWNELKANFQLNTYYPAHFLWRDQLAKNVAIRSRGTGSRSGSKPGLRVDFNFLDENQQFSD